MVFGVSFVIWKQIDQKYVREEEYLRFLARFARKLQKEDGKIQPFSLLAWHLVA